MALRNPKLFGLNVLSFFADVENKNAALRSLNLNSLDLDVIRGSANANVERLDWISLSRLKQPIHKAVTRFQFETTQYPTVLEQRAGIDNILFGNLVINGALSGNAVRYRYIKNLNNETPGVTREIGFADISTSRVSSWSSSANPVIATSPISYGSRVAIKDGSALQFGPPATSGQTRLKTSTAPIAKEFDSELPTSKITTTITDANGNTQTVKLYAMKGIPLIFRGFFRNFNASIVISQIKVAGVDIPASWKVVETGNPNSYVSFPNKGAATSSISFSSSRSRERNIQFYYNPDNIKQITLQSAGIDTLPVTRLSELTFLNLRYNNLKNFPDFTVFSPNLTQLLLSRNPFYLSENPNERRLNQNIIDKIPADLTRLDLPGTFYGSIDPNIFNKFTKITELQLGRGGGAYFHPDGNNGNTPLPNISNTCETYTAYNNDFRSIDATPGGSLKNIKQLNDLTSLHLSGNYNLSDGGEFQIVSQKINYINLTSTALNIPNLSGRTELTEANMGYMRVPKSVIGGVTQPFGLFENDSFKFSACDSVRTLYFYATPLGGPFPKFTNPSLTYLEMRRTNITGGFKDGSTTNNTNVIHADTFKNCPNLETFYVESGNLLTAEIDNTAFTFTPALKNIIYNSRGRTGGTIPNFNSCTNLRYLNLYNNAFNSGTPGLTSAENINYVNLSYNQLTGVIPPYRNLSNLVQLYLNNNKYTVLSEFENLPNLRYFYCHNQRTGVPGSGISGEIPDFTGCPRMYYLIMYNNAFTGYKTKSFESLDQLKYLDLSNNNLSAQALEKIIADLYQNYTDAPRGGVTINVKNAMVSGASISEESLELVVLLRSKGWTVILQ